MKILLVLLLLSGCATMFHGSRQKVFFKGAPDEGVTKITTPTEVIEIEGDGTSMRLISRSRSDIPISITCPSGKKFDDVLETSWSWGWGGFGNILNYGIGWLVDPFTDSAYNIQENYIVRKCGAI